MVGHPHRKRKSYLDFRFYDQWIFFSFVFQSKQHPFDSRGRKEEKVKESFGIEEVSSELSLALDRIICIILMPPVHIADVQTNGKAIMSLGHKSVTGIFQLGSRQRNNYHFLFSYHCLVTVAVRLRLLSCLRFFLLSRA